MQTPSAIVTGAGNGIGRAIAHRLAGDGLCVGVLDIDAGGVADSVGSIIAGGGSAVALTADLLDPEAIDQAVGRFVVETGRIDVLINNAGLMDGMLTVETVTLDQWQRVMGVNVTAPFLLCKAVIPTMLAQNAGSIVNIASIAGVAGGRAGTAYTASKHAVIGLTKSIAWTYADRGLRCNAVCPGGVVTGIGKRQLKGTVDELGAQRFRAATALKPRSADPSEIANVVRFLASQEASFINGAVIVADAGWTAC
jgi:NAD(P)-dependent dehydrogenase (short-subunit alcohol dehydrogenase family)